MNVHNHSKDMMQYIVTHAEAVQQIPMIQFVSFSLLFENEQNPDGDPYSCLFNAMDKETI